MENEVLELPPRAEEKPGAVMMAAGPLNMAMQAMKAGMSIADMRAMLELQKEWEANEARKAYMKAMSGFAAEGVKIHKNKVVDFQPKNGGRVRYSHAELSDVTSAVCPALAKHQLSHRWDVTQSADGNLVTVTCRITHALGHSETISLTGGQDATGNKNPIQQTGSTITYLQRYTLLAITGMSTSGEDDDGRGGEEFTGQDQGAAEDSFRRVEERDQPRKPPHMPAAAAFCPQARFDQNLPEWTRMIRSGAKPVERLIAYINKNQALTDAQMQTLRAITVTATA